ncbi:hypothetical protein V6B16_04395 [Salinimicrobium catena]|uniref:hypothetical protein n=1 Tax=Salinimicrobium catena TaxID=390640 RepID=UPI002FE4A759
MRKKTIVIIAGSVLGLLLLILLGGFYFSGKIKDRIGKAVQDYEEIDVDLFQQNIHVKRVQMEQGQGTLSAAEVSVLGISYWKYLTEGNLVMDQIVVRSPEITINRKKEKQQDSGKAFKKEILIRDFQATDGTFRLKNKDSTGNAIFFSFPELKLSQIKIDSASRGNMLPFKYESYSLKSDSLAVSMNPQHFIAAEEFSVQNGKTSISNFRIIPYYERDEFDRQIPYEKDRIALTVNQITLDTLDFNFKNDTLHLYDPLLKVTGADLDIYRNKLLPDDERTKTLFSQKIRNSPVKFDFEKIQVNNSKIRYEEKLNETGPPVKVFFTGIEGSVQDLQNINLNAEDFPRTTVDASALFMGETSLTLDWSFNVSNPNEKFLISGEFGTVPGELLNPMLKPSLGMEAEGKLQSVYFTFTGNEEMATGDVRVSYDRFKINIMKDQGRKENKLLSALANLFVDNDGLSEQRTHSVEFTRDKTKSFWNYVWKGLKKGVIDALGQL